MVLVLLAASVILIANTIRLSIFSRRREIEVMKLVGATNWFVRGPFMLEGLLCGLVGSIAAVALLLLGKTVALPAILGHIDTTDDVKAWPFVTTAVASAGRRPRRRSARLRHDTATVPEDLASLTPPLRSLNARRT